MERNQIQQFFTWRTAIADSDLHSSTKLVLFIISLHMNEASTGAFPSVRTIAKKCSLSKPSVILHIATAREKGWILLESREHANGASRSNMYSANIPVAGGVKSLNPGVKSVNPGGVKSVNPYNSPLLTNSFKKLNKKADRVIRHLNKVTGKNFRFSKSSREHIAARLKDGFKTKDCIAVIDIKSQDEYFIENPQHMNPVTLFRPKKFESYLNEIPKKTKSPENKRAGQKYGHLIKTIIAGGVEYKKGDPNLPEEIKKQFEEMENA